MRTLTLNFDNRLVLNGKTFIEVMESSGIIPKRTAKHWSKEDDKVLASMLSNGSSAADIGIRLNRTAPAVSSRASHLHLKVNK